jgi:hypothetical protein
MFNVSYIIKYDNGCFNYVEKKTFLYKIYLLLNKMFKFKYKQNNWKNAEYLSLDNVQCEEIKFKKAFPITKLRGE